MEQRHLTGLCLFAFAAFVVGDSVTTAIGLSGGAVESNPWPPRCWMGPAGPA